MRTLLRYVCAAIVLASGGCGEDPAPDTQSGAGSSAVAGTAASAAGHGGSGGRAASAAAAGSSGATAARAGSGGANANAGGGGAATTAGNGGAPASGSGGSAGAAGGAGSAGAAGTAGTDDDRCAVAVEDPAKEPAGLELTGNLGTHDPTVIEQDGTYYLYNTGAGLPGKVSTDLKRWDSAPRAFNSNPGWIAGQVPAATDLWAPDLSYFGGQYHLYYSASSFGSNRSCIGHATRASLAQGSWSDQGAVVCSQTSDNWNAIDPNAIVDRDGKAHLVFGSFWDGIRMIDLHDSGARQGTALRAVASRGGGAIEAPVIVRRCGYYYLFVSFDRCCQGANSTYNIRYGRSESIMGPYLDESGGELLDDGGSLLLEGAGNVRGPGHNAVLFTGTRAYNVYHMYESPGGASRLRVAELVWNADGWPRSGGP